MERDIEVVAEAATGDEALAMARLHRPDIALLDIEMPGPDGIEVARRLTADGYRGKAIIVTTFGRPGFLPAAMSAGASGFWLKDAPAADLATAIRRVHAGERVVDPALAAAALAEGRRKPVNPTRGRSARRCSRARRDRRTRGQAPPVTRDRTQPPVGSDPETGCAQPRGSGTDRGAQGLAMMRPRAAPTVAIRAAVVQPSCSRRGSRVIPLRSVE